MTSSRRLSPVGVIALTISVSCQPSPERAAADTARNTSQVASGTQQQLWQQAADKGEAPGLQRVPIVPEPVVRRDRLAAAPSQGKPGQSPGITIPPSVISQIRILAYPANPFETYSGPATVRRIEQGGERLELDLGVRGTLTVLARAGGKPLPLQEKQMVSVVYRSRRNPQVPDDVIAILTPTGAGIAHVIQSGKGPVTVVVPLMGVTAVQLGDQASPPVQISAGPAFMTMSLDTIGQMKLESSSNTAALLLGSIGSDKGTGGSAGAPFTINVVVWKVP